MSDILQHGRVVCVFLAADTVKVVPRAMVRCGLWWTGEPGGPAALCAEAALSWQGLGAGTVNGREKDMGVWF